jgi:hypothetical protein
MGGNGEKIDNPYGPLVAKPLRFENLGYPMGINVVEKM